jgi:hypothetical protein
MFLSILLYAIAVFLTGFTIMLFFPISFSLHCNYVPALESAWVKMSLLHPWVLYGHIEFKKKVLDIRLFNRFVVYSRSFAKGPNGEVPEREEDAPAASAPFHGEAASPQKATDSSTVHETEDNTEQAEHLYSPGPDHGKPDAASIGEEKKKKEGLIAKLRSIRDRYRNGSLRKALFFLRQGPWRRKILRWLGRTISPLFHLFTVRHMRIHVRASLPEPSATGKLFGYWTGISHALIYDKMKKHEIVFEPVFNKECLDVEASLRIQTSLLRFMAPVIIMVVTFPYFSTLRVWLAIRKTARKEKSA